MPPSKKTRRPSRRAIRFMSESTGDDNILELTNLSKRFGGLLAVDNVSLHIKRGEVFALIGPNGAGKTTLFNNVTGLFQPTSGQVVFDGRDITGSRPHTVARLGIARTFQNIRLFSYMSSPRQRARRPTRPNARSTIWDSLFKAAVRSGTRRNGSQRKRWTFSALSA